MNISHHFFKESDFTELMLACKHRDLQKVKQLVKAGSNVNETTKHGITPLMVACKYSRTDNENVIQEIEDQLKSTGKIKTLSLIQSSIQSSIGIIEYLLKKGADINMRQDNGATALCVAVNYSGSLSTEDTVKILLENGASPNIANKFRRLPLFIAARFSGSFSTENTVKMLLEAGSELNIKNDMNDTVLHYMYDCHNVENDNIKYYSDNTVKMLLDAGVNINTQTVSGYTPLTLACKNINGDINILLERDANPNLQMKDGNTALHYTCRLDKNNKRVELLLKAGANPNIKNATGFTALHCMCMNSMYMSHDYKQTFNSLLKAGADINCQTNIGTTPLLMSLEYTRPILTKMLLEKGANPNIADRNGNTPISYVISKSYMFNCLKMIRMLFNYGAKPNKDKIKSVSVIDSWFMLKTPHIPTLHTLSLRYIKIHNIQNIGVPKSVLKFTQYT